LQHALKELWQARRGPWLTLDAYEKSGGVAGALRRRAQYPIGTVDEEPPPRHGVIYCGRSRDAGWAERSPPLVDEYIGARLCRKAIQVIFFRGR
jgi:hypothetical protein